ncbi:hypothetical protein LJC53_02145 [Bacteroidales bacterium OttesenSCG-928-C03]|nr:hypothetical protein [Bacteroidales bacterium OttesenSCG-928-C03]
MRKRIWIISGVLVSVFAIISLVVFKNNETSIVEQVKKSSAKIRKIEYIPNQDFLIEDREAFQKKDSIYTDFRAAFKYHFQTIGLATFSDSSRLILISDPPSYFEIDTIKSLFSKFTHGVEAKQHKVGYDGRITDILILVGNATTENITNLTTKLSEILFLSAYKPQIISLDSNLRRDYFVEKNIDYQITLYEFNEWFIESEEVFVRLEDTSKRETVKLIFSERKTGVYFSEIPGFVAWAIDKKSDLKEQVHNIRQFTLDADLILGALADTGTLVIIGRERDATLFELPPLHVESILLLASVTEKELSQSLDVNDLLAGKMKNGRDWCPTYLSKELENTEFGHLMTITDILLKDWSEKGTIQELDYKYPEPKRYPFDRPLFKKLGISELVYNWNTHNAMYAIDMDDVTIYTLNRTGSLPVSYFNSQERSISIGRKYENQAYNYFATVGNTDLARVVQYTALYQLFIDNEITYSGDIESTYPKNRSSVLVKPVKNLLTILKDITDQEISHLADTFATVRYHAWQKEKVEEQLQKNEKNYKFTYTEDHKKRIIDDFLKNNKEDLAKEFRKVKSMLNNLSEEQFNRLAGYLAYPRGTRIDSREKYNMMLKAKQVKELIQSLGKQYLGIINAELGTVRNYYVNSLSGSSGKYLKTPSIIVTFNDFLTTGGHNLSSKISRVNSLTNYKQSGGGGSGEKPKTTAAPSTPTAQKKPSQSSQPSQSSKSPSSSGGGTTKSSTSKPSSTASTPKASPAKPATRPRGEVISGAARTQRGI